MYQYINKTDNKLDHTLEIDRFLTSNDQYCFYLKEIRKTEARLRVQFLLNHPVYNNEVGLFHEDTGISSQSLLTLTPFFQKYCTNIRQYE